MDVSGSVPQVKDNEQASDTTKPSGGLHRRELLRRALIAGAVGWTAPLLVESLASPASAASLSGCYRLLLNQDASCTVLSYVASAVLCEPVYLPCVGTPTNGSGTLATFGITNANGCGQAGQAYVFNISAPCTFVSGTALTDKSGQPSICTVGIRTNVNTTLTFPNPGNGFKYKEIRIVVTC